MGGIRLIVAGSRSFTDAAFAFRKLDALTANMAGPITVISGHARGGDAIGEQWAAARGHAVDVYAADWNRHGKAAGPMRNSDMVAAATHAVFFWDGRSRGTADCIRKAKEAGLAVRVVMI